MGNNKGSKKKEVNKGGRPKIEFDENQWEEFEKLCGLQCTLAEIANFFKCSEDTIERRVKEKFSEGFAEIFKIKSQIGKTSLRRLQFKSAENGNIAMQIWLGKNWLGQSDKREDSITYPQIERIIDDVIGAVAAEITDADVLKRIVGRIHKGEDSDSSQGKD